VGCSFGGRAGSHDRRRHWRHGDPAQPEIASYTGCEQVVGKLRAVENGRWVVQVSPTGFSAFVDANGGVYQRTDVSEQRVITMDVPLRSGHTWYTTIGNWPWVVALALLLGVSTWRTRQMLTDSTAD
jgi:apolipoprotein N-acyltransferase